MNYRYKRYMMRKIRRECYRSYRKSSNNRTVPKNNLNNTRVTVSGTEAFIIWMIIILFVGFFIFAFTV